MLLTMMVDSATEDGLPASVVATQQQYRDAMAGGFVNAIIGYTSDGQAAGFALYSWFFLPQHGLPALEVLDLYASTALKGGSGGGRAQLNRQLFSACCQIAEKHKAGAVEWRISANNTEKGQFAESIGALPDKNQVSMLITGQQNVAEIARITDQKLPWISQ